MGEVIATPGRVDELRMIGERPCLDFANTLDPRLGDRQLEFLPRYLDLVAWARRAEVIDPAEARTLTQRAAQQEKRAAAALVDAIALREAMYGVVAAIARGDNPPSSDQSALRRIWAEASLRADLARHGDALVWEWSVDVAGLDVIRWRLAHSAIELLTHAPLDRIRLCPGMDDCGWVFLDTSKNGRRRWCSMEGCGNRAKVRRYYQRAHQREV